MSGHFTIEKTEIIDEQQRGKSFTSSATRGLVGGALLGPVGLLAGSLSGKNKKDKVTFLVTYKDGHTSIETVKKGSIIYKTYIKLISK